MGRLWNKIRGLAGLGAVLPARPPTWYGVNEDDLRAAWDVIKNDAGGYGFVWLGAGNTGQHYWTAPEYPIDLITMCGIEVNGIPATIPCDLHPGPRPPNARELDQWWAATAVSRWGNNSWWVANGERPFATVHGPDGTRYWKYYNGDQVAHGRQPPGTVSVRIASDDYLGWVGDVAAFIAKNVCLIGGSVMASQPGAAQAAAGAAGLCRTLLGQNTPATPPPGTPGGGLRLVKGAGPEVYGVENGVRHWIPDPETFAALRLDAAKIENISEDELLRIPLGAPVPSHRPSAAPAPQAAPPYNPYANPWYKSPWVAVAGGVLVLGTGVFLLTR